MKPILLLAALALPATAGAQSLPDTHELVWHPAGKTPAATYRPRERPACVEAATHHRAGRGQMTPPARCTVAAKATTAPAVAR
ncbi:MAG: hypothetical protein J0I47_13895 [Sphingomonas sp.]|uniref:hypothetical protein n=1 Tax=Sphingomonas sp. TaxID=28214 RepID=UPI001ACDEFF2|nr:hypothetical protein [Sphingomonas sp.]MBN8809310.1 hypothetical protein [Sphingomonas sp.]